MEAMDYWRLCKRVSVFQAVMLVLGYDPGNTAAKEYESDSVSHEGYGAVKTALLDAVKSGDLEADIREEYEYDNHGEVCGTVNQTVNLDRTTLAVDSIKLLLKERGFATGFFFPERVMANEFLDPDHPSYANKLAAAVNAWTAVSGDETLLRGKTPKQAMEKWLREHATKFGLTKDDGSPNETGIQEICKIANWRPEGGAARTPDPPPANSNPSPPGEPLKLKKIQNGKQPPISFDPDSDIPF